MIDQIGHLLFLMMAGHALADFGLQDGFHSQAKRPGNTTNIHWFFGLSCHALIHGGSVALVTGSWKLGVAETIMHGYIDFGKARGYYGTIVDQAMHFFCKLAWIFIAIYC